MASSVVVQRRYSGSHVAVRLALSTDDLEFAGSGDACVCASPERCTVSQSVRDPDELARSSENRQEGRSPNLQR